MNKPNPNSYDAIHFWLRKHYGKADICENPNCKGISKRYHWCLIKGKAHKKDASNYIKLCASCHRLYDQTPEWIEKIAKKRRERKTQPQGTKNRISASMKGKNIGNKRAAKPIQQRLTNGVLVKNWDCASDASKELGISAGGISMCCSGKLKTCGGYIWNFLTN